MKQFLPFLLISFLAATPGLSLAQVDDSLTQAFIVAQKDRTIAREILNSQDLLHYQKEEKDLMSLDFSGGSVDDFIKFLKESHEKKGHGVFNIIATEDTGDVGIPAFKVANTSVKQILWLLEKLSGEKLVFEQPEGESNLVLISKRVIPEAIEVPLLGKQFGSNHSKVIGARAKEQAMAARQRQIDLLNKGFGSSHPKVIAAKAIEKAAAKIEKKRNEKKKLRIYGVSSFINNGLPHSGKYPILAETKEQKERIKEKREDANTLHIDKKIQALNDLLNVSFEELEEPRPNMNFHRGTESLIITGTAKQIEITDQIFAGLLGE